jgi:uncharacterized protein YjbI with pentapeptide repeats
MSVAELAQISALRRGEEKGPVSLEGARLIGADLSELDLSGANLSGANLSGANLSGANLMGANLKGTILFEANLDHTDFSMANLQGAQLDSAVGRHVGFAGADLTGASLIAATLPESALTRATLHDAALVRSDLTGSRFREADLTRANFTGAGLGGVDMAGATMVDAVFNEADMRGAALSATRGFEQAQWIGTDMRDINFTGAYLLRRWAMDQNYLDEFRRQSRFHAGLYRVWWATSDCGRSLGRWACVVLALTLAFAGLYTLVDLDYGSYETWLSPMYYSVVTMTTLGYGDVLPATLGAQIMCMAEVVIGYIMLGGLLSIFSNKMARRAE